MNNKSDKASTILVKLVGKEAPLDEGDRSFDMISSKHCVPYYVFVTVCL